LPSPRRDVSIQHLEPDKAIGFRLRQLIDRLGIAFLVKEGALAEQ
jgi:hypothetical protein